MKKLKDERLRVKKILLEYELCLKGEKPKISETYSDDENAFSIPTDQQLRNQRKSATNKYRYTTNDSSSFNDPESLKPLS